MKLELIIFGIAGFLIYNTYRGNKYSKVLLSYKKYYQMIIIAIVAFSIYMLVRRDPTKSKQMLLYANNMIKYMPIDKSSMSIISPIFDFTNTNKGFMGEMNTNIDAGYNSIIPPNPLGINSARKATKRSVSETKKKYVAYLQDWNCGKCNNRLNHTFEVDHKIRLENGGGNDVSNLVALCRECHGRKTAFENM